MRAREASLCGSGWRMHHPDGRSWPACVPGCAHLDLMRAGEIPSPDAEGGEDAQSHVGRTEWAWTAGIEVPAELRAHRHIDLVLHAVDTVATVTCAGRTVLETDSAFHPWRADLAGLVASAAGDAALPLRVQCTAPVVEVERLQQLLGPRPVNGDWTPYPFIRKAACNFGWDWGPRVPTSGLPGPVMLHAWTGARMDTVMPLVIRCDAEMAVVEARVACVLDADAPPCAVRVSLESPDGRRWEDEAAVGPDGHALVRIEVPRPMRWWPRGMGTAHLHRLSVELESGSATLERRSMRIGLRSVSLDLSPDADGTAFAIVVNGMRTWCAGANWIPEGLFPPALDPATLRERILQACDAHMRMLRVWGGGGYESDSFYEACDELGILVWQDFAFACATYPEDAPFPQRIEREARWQVARLSRHPSVVLWCGGNEDILAWWSWGFRERLAHGQSWGRHYWLELLPRICAELDPTRPYWPESPWSGSLELHPNDRGRGDCHIWDADAKVEAIRGTPPRFASEFGHQSPPSLRTVAEALAVGAHGDADALERALAALPAAQGQARLAPRQRAWGGDDAQYAPFLSERFGDARDFLEWIVQAQVVQARAMRAAYAWFRSSAPRCMGALCWQMNDAWTGHSWSLVDVKGRVKPAWHAVRDACAPRMIAIHPRAGAGGIPALTLDAVNDTGDAWKGTATLALHPLDGSAPRCALRVPFLVAPWACMTIETLPAELAPGHDALLMAEAATGLAAHPEARAWHASAHDRALESPGGGPWHPSGTISDRDGSLHAVRVTAVTPLLDAAVVPVGDWLSCEPMLMTLRAGESQDARISWRGKPGQVQLHCSGRTIAMAEPARAG